MNKYMDWISVMTYVKKYIKCKMLVTIINESLRNYVYRYDYHGQWDKKTGHVAPMYNHEESDNFYFNSNYTINYWLSKGADKKKLVMGM
jgi:chitinase